MLNKILSVTGLELSRTRQSRIPRKFRSSFNRFLADVKRNPPSGFNIIKDIMYDVGVHPLSYIDYECQFTAYHISSLKPQNIIDVGSYRQFILGLLSHFRVTTIDVRERKLTSGNEIPISCDAKSLPLPDNSFDAAVSLCSLEHFGLGRFGDQFDLDADRKAFSEMVRVLKPGGHLIFTTTINRAKPSIAFNAHRIYSYEMLRQLCSDLEYVDEKFYSHKLRDFCSLDEVTKEKGVWDIYCGCWKKRLNRGIIHPG